MSSDRATFFDLYARGDALEEEVDDYVDYWHEEMAGRDINEVTSLATYLGLTNEEYAAWVEDGTALPRILMARLSGVPLAEALEQEDYDLRLAARAPNANEMTKLVDLLRRRRES